MFAAYVVVTLPVLALMLVVFINNAPDLLVTLGDALLVQIDAFFSIAERNGDLLGAVAAAAQAAILVLEIFGLIVFLSKLVWNPLRRLRRARSPV